MRSPIESTPQLEQLIKEGRPIPRAGFIDELEQKLQLSQSSEINDQAVRSDKQNQFRWFPAQRMALPALAILATLAVGSGARVAYNLSNPEDSGIAASSNETNLTAATSAEDRSSSLKSQPEIQALGAAGANDSVGTSEPAGAAGATGAMKRSASPMDLATGDSSAADRKQIVNRGLTLKVERGETSNVTSKITKAVAQSGGFIENSSISQRSSGTSRGSISIKVPTEKVESLIETISTYGDVIKSERGSYDVTNRFNSYKSILRDSRNERSALLKALKSSTSADEISRLKRQIDRNRMAVERRERNLKRLQNQLTMTDLHVELTDHQPKTSSGSDGILGNSWSAFKKVVETMVYGAAILLPLLIGLALLAGLLKLLPSGRR